MVGLTTVRGSNGWLVACQTSSYVKPILFGDLPGFTTIKWVSGIRIFFRGVFKRDLLLIFFLLLSAPLLFGMKGIRPLLFPKCLCAVAHESHRYIWYIFFPSRTIYFVFQMKCNTALQ